MAHPLTEEEFRFFARDAKTRAALEIYEALRERLFSECPELRVAVKKTQISFKNRHLFAAASFAAVRRASERPAVWLTVTFGLPYRLESPRVDAAVEAYPGRWTHHVMVGGAAEIDDELLSWLREAAAFAAGKGHSAR